MLVLGQYLCEAIYLYLICPYPFDPYFLVLVFLSHPALLYINMPHSGVEFVGVSCDYPDRLSIIAQNRRFISQFQVDFHK